MLIKVLTELPSGKTTSLVARIFDRTGDIFTIRYLSPSEDTDHGCVVYRYEDQTYEIDDDSITSYLGTDDETDIGFRAVLDGGFVRCDSDSDYVPSSEEDTESESEDVESDQDSYVDED